MERQYSVGESVRVNCPVCQRGKFGNVNYDLKTAKVPDHLSPTGKKGCDGVGKNVKFLKE